MWCSCQCLQQAQKWLGRAHCYHCIPVLQQDGLKGCLQMEVARVVTLQAWLLLRQLCVLTGDFTRRAHSLPYKFSRLTCGPNCIALLP